MKLDPCHFVRLKLVLNPFLLYFRMDQNALAFNPHVGPTCQLYLLPPPSALFSHLYLSPPPPPLCRCLWISFVHGIFPMTWIFFADLLSRFRLLGFFLAFFPRRGVFLRKCCRLTTATSKNVVHTVECKAMCISLWNCFGIPHYMPLGGNLYTLMLETFRRITRVYCTLGPLLDSITGP